MQLVRASILHTVVLTKRGSSYLVMICLKQSYCIELSWVYRYIPGEGVTVNEGPLLILEEEADFLLGITNVGNVSHGSGENKSDLKKEVTNIVGVLNPTTCLHMGDVLLFAVDKRHYPEYDRWVPTTHLYIVNLCCGWIWHFDSHCPVPQRQSV